MHFIIIACDSLLIITSFQKKQNKKKNISIYASWREWLYSDMMLLKVNFVTGRLYSSLLLLINTTLCATSKLINFQLRFRLWTIPLDSPEVWRGTETSFLWNCLLHILCANKIKDLHVGAPRTCCFQRSSLGPGALIKNNELILVRSDLWTSGNGFKALFQVDRQQQLLL